MIRLLSLLPETVHHVNPVVGRIGHPEDQTVRYSRGRTERTVTIRFDVETDEDVQKVCEAAYALNEGQ